MSRNNPFRIDGPALLSVSGGRTSGYMLRRILDAHGGRLPANVYPVFANTGKEREETLVFLREIERRWEVPITWIEYDPARARAGEGCFREVYFETASRKGEPFERMIHARHDRPNSPPYLPNGVQRICTHYLKVLVFRDFMGFMGYGFADKGDWANIIGIRADEPRRVAKMKARNDSGEDNRLPLAEAGVIKAEVMQFWAEQDFDLGLESWEGNCDFCFLKGRRLRVRTLMDDPGIGAWWREQEEKVGATFDKGVSVADLERQAGYLRSLPVLPGLFDDAEGDEGETGRVACLCTD